MKRLDLTTKKMTDNCTEDMPYYRLGGLIISLMMVGLMLGVGVLYVRVKKVMYRLEHSGEVLLRDL